MSILIASILLLISVVGGTIVMFVFVPNFHSLIPGYRSPEDIKKETASLTTALNNAELALDKCFQFTNSMKRMLAPENDSMPTLSQGKLDSLLASEMAEIAQSNAAAAPSTPASSVIESGSSDQNASATDAVRVVYVPEERNPAVRMPEKSVLMTLVAPLKGEIRNQFNPEKKHYGVDIVAEEKTLIRSICNGYVVVSEYSDDNGWIIGVASEGNILSFYKHNNRLLKEAGTYVLAGEPIAVIGNTGENTTGTHLHLELWHKGKPLDPANYIKFNR
ncbi:peptidoglycan DD-metalloendopeptidase family protein [Pontibacter sp. G13]|uniref:M23 family metallopeptidase n=1 Tax=Pontibacter sp. G13 TaxID=3074898 RepID=UPI002888FDCB|nr:peptidoglycan DD-metalloendopeptidase family protein [Pontibacter sp. G13]WNJ21397.1 peptidoglycan DD-metalloendopeptidase family protein [Pontibacter sp. G13]